MIKALLFAGAASLAVVAAMPAAAQTAPAAAQDQAADDNAPQPGDIVVTAQKRSERLQDVPFAVSVIGGMTWRRLAR